MKKKIKFIINPLSGGKNKKGIPQIIDRVIDQTIFDIEYSVSESEAETIAIASDGKHKQLDAIIAVGGDGTINNIARHLAGSEIALGIVPMGSGNGFARELGIPLSVQKSLEIINRFNIKKVDTGMVNDQTFINVCGVGFDAHVSSLFAGSRTRGFSNYIRITLKELYAYKSQTYELVIDGKQYTQKAFMLVICNGTQFGNNAYIAPGAIFDDGIFNITIIEEFKFWNALGLISHLFMKNINKDRNVKTYTGKNIQVMRKNAGHVNIDGEPVLLDNNLNIQVNPLSLNIILP
ncbi:MAG: diacylglycerol kinase family lipid kinase [Bacteroidota bacterium]|nr:diacylglycerol kinase family lipid kinase [Bacteroidota bacterium]